jgi:hypothetical protein
MSRNLTGLTSQVWAERRLVSAVGGLGSSLLDFARDDFITMRYCDRSL